MVYGFRNRAGMATAASLYIGCTLGLAGIGSFALLAPRATDPAETTAPPVVTAAPAQAGGEVDFHDLARRCVNAFSKDLCEGALNPGELVFGTCPLTNCRTTYVHQANWEFSLRHNQQVCSGPFDPFIGRCDEAIGKDGRLGAEIDFTMRHHQSCRFRAGLSGRWRFEGNDGSQYEGRVIGTMGVGSHRGSACPEGSRNCERCLDVSFDQATGLWRIGVEASFQGICVNCAGLTPDELFFTLSGDFFAPGDANGPFDPAGGWRFFGTADGVHLQPCN